MLYSFLQYIVLIQGTSIVYSDLTSTKFTVIEFVSIESKHSLNLTIDKVVAHEGDELDFLIWKPFASLSLQQIRSVFSIC